MNKRTNIFIVDGDSNFSDQIQDVLIKNQGVGIDVLGKVLTKGEFLHDKRLISETDVFIISASLPDGTGLELVEYILRNDAIKNKPIIFTVNKQTRNHSTAAREMGVYDVLPKPFSLKDLFTTITESIEGLNFNEGDTTNDDDDEVDVFNPFSEENTFPYNNMESDLFDEIDNSKLLNTSSRRKDEDAKPELKKGVYSFISSSSSGKTSLIANIAYAIRSKSKVKPSVCIVDLDLLYPSVSYLFNQDELRIPSRSIYDVGLDMAYMDEELMSNAIILHAPTGINILNTPSDVDSLSKISHLKSDHIEKIINQLKNMFDVVLIDTGRDITSFQLATAVSNSDEIFLVMEPNYIDVVSSNKILEIIKVMENSVQEDLIVKTNLILNRESKNRSIDSDTVEDFLDGKEFLIRIPEDERFLSFINRGKFLVDTDSPTSKPILEISSHIYPLSNNFKRKNQGPSLKNPLKGLFKGRK